jgi:hypothetical protein
MMTHCQGVVSTGFMGCKTILVNCPWFAAPAKRCVSPCKRRGGHPCTCFAGRPGGFETIHEPDILTFDFPDPCQTASSTTSNMRNATLCGSNCVSRHRRLVNSRRGSALVNTSRESQLHPHFCGSGCQPLQFGFSGARNKVELVDRIVKKTGPRLPEFVLFVAQHL